jgi:hypothetical protein
MTTCSRFKPSSASRSSHQHRPCCVAAQDEGYGQWALADTSLQPIRVSQHKRAARDIAVCVDTPSKSYGIGLHIPPPPSIVLTGERQIPNRRTMRVA